MPGGSTHQWLTECPSTQAEGVIPAWNPSCSARAPLGLLGGARVGYNFAPFGVEAFGLGAGDWSQANFDEPFPLAEQAGTSMLIARVGGGFGAGVRLMTEPGLFRVHGGVGGGAMFRHVFTSFSSLDGSSTKYQAPFLMADLNLTFLKFLNVGVMLMVEFSPDVTVPTNFGAVVPIPELVEPVEDALGSTTVFKGPQVFLGPTVGLLFGG